MRIMRFTGLAGALLALALITGACGSKLSFEAATLADGNESSVGNGCEQAGVSANVMASVKRAPDGSWGGAERENRPVYGDAMDGGDLSISLSPGIGAERTTAQMGTQGSYICRVVTFGDGKAKDLEMPDGLQLVFIPEEGPKSFVVWAYDSQL